MFLFLVFGIGIGYLIRNQIEILSDPQLPEEVAKIAKDIRIVVRESDMKNRTLYLDVNQWYCKFKIFYGGSNPYPSDLAKGKAPIVFFFLEDIEDPQKADNYSDLIVRINPIIDKEDGKLKMVLVFFAEGGYDKLVYLDNKLLYFYNSTAPTPPTNYKQNYGITTVEIP